MENNVDNSGVKKEETKKCKYCQSEIPKNAKICPVCKKRQKPGGCLIAVIVVIVLIIFAAIAGSGDSGSDVSVVSTESPVSDTSANDSAEISTEISNGEIETSAVETEAAESNRFNVGDVIETDGLQITYITAEPYSSDNQFLQPKDGYEYWRFEFKFENLSDSDKSISSMLGWECYADNTIVEQTWIGDDTSLDGTLSAGRQAQGSLYFEVPIGAENIELEYSPNVWLDDKIVFVAK